MSVVFKTFDVIEIDGIVAGNIVDVISNHAPRRAEVLAAYGVYVAAINAEKATLTTEKNEAINQANTTATQLATMTTQRDELLGEKTALTANVATLQTQVTTLTAIRAYNPRWTTPEHFINRFTAHEAKAFYRSDDPMIEGGRQLLEAYEAATWYVDLDDTQVQGLTGYMVQLGMLSSPERRAQVLRDVTAQEAWYPQ